jgi:hypothetical protein
MNYAGLQYKVCQSRMLKLWIPGSSQWMACKEISSGLRRPPPCNDVITFCHAAPTAPATSLRRRD